jgi:hypothetical protein
MNAGAAVQNWQMSFTNGTDLSTMFEFGVVADVAATAYAQAGMLELVSVASSSTDVRSTTSVTMNFFAATGSGAALADTVCLTLQGMWMPMKMADGTWASANAMSLTKLADPAVNGSADVSVAMTVTRFSGQTVCGLMDDAATNNMTENSNYTLVVSGLPTPDYAMSADESQMVLSVAVSTAGGLAHSCGHMYNGVWPSYSVPSGMHMLDTDSLTYTVNRGTYSMDAVVVMPLDAAGVVQRFTEDVSLAIASAGGVIQMEPATISAGLGDDFMMGMLGAAVTSQVSTYLVYWTKTGGASYTDVAPIEVVVGSDLSTVTVPGTAVCSLGGSSVPMAVTLGACPHTDVTVALTVTAYDNTDETAVDPSAGLNPPADAVTLSLTNPMAVLGFTCDADAAGTSLTYVLAGTDMAAFTLSAATVTVTAQEGASAAVANPDMTIAQVTDSTTASDMALTGLCPAIGEGWMFFVPAELNTVDADGVSEGLNMTEEEVLALTAAVDAILMSDAAMASDF